MYKTEVEIFSQHDALVKTYEYLTGRSGEIKAFLGRKKFNSVTFIGCGSSHSLCKSASLSTRLSSGICTYAIAAGDLMLNFSMYGKLLEDTLIVAPSRSGSTSEVLIAVKEAKEKFGVPCISIAAVEKSSLSKISDYSIELPWAFDESVCQTRTVTNLYCANLILTALISNDSVLLAEIGKAVWSQKKFLDRNREVLKDIGAREWENAVVLADAELEGIAEEGALAFKEICQYQSNYYHILDVRHGPAVMVTGKTLVIIMKTLNQDSYQFDLVKEMVNKGAVVVTAGCGPESIPGTAAHIAIPAYERYSVCGIPFITIPQMLTLFKALSKGINPDEPHGLDAWIKL